MAIEVIVPIQMRFGDIDSYSHVNNIAQQSYFDVGKSAFFEKLWQEVGEAERRDVMIVSVQTDFVAQIRYGDKIEVVTSVKSIGNKSLTLRQEILREGVLCSRSRAVMVCYDRERGEATEVPDSWRKVVECK